MSARRDCCRSRCARSRPQQRVSLFVNEKPLSHAGGRQGEQALRRHRPRGAAAPGRQPRSAAPSRARPTSPGGKRAAAARDVAGAGPGVAGTADRPARAASRRARSTSAARAAARWCRAAPPRGFRSTSSCRRARTWRSRTAPPARAARSLAQVAVDGKPARTVHEGTVGAAWTDALVDLGAAGGQAARIDLDRARHQGRPRLGRAARRRQVARAAPPPRPRSPSSTTSSSGWSTRCAPTSCTPTTRRRAS